MQFHTEKGIVNLSNEGAISPELTQALLPVHFPSVKPYNFSSIPYRWFSASGGQFEGNELKIEFCFFREMLVHADLHVVLNSDGVWMHTTSEAEFGQAIEQEAVQIKRIHDKILAENLGNTRITVSQRVSRLSATPSTSLPATEFCYKYPWGYIASLFPHAHPFIRVEYEGRRRQAEKRADYENLRGNTSAAQTLRSRILNRA